jgi:hypothetical protein
MYPKSKILKRGGRWTKKLKMEIIKSMELTYNQQKDKMIKEQKQLVVKSLLNSFDAINKAKPKPRKTVVVNEVEIPLDQKRLQILSDVRNKIILNPRNLNIQHIGDHIFQVNQNNWSGLKPILKKAIWPDTSDNPFTQDKDEHNRRKTKRINKESTNKCSSSGVDHGTHVHRQMEKIINAIVDKKTYEQIYMSLGDVDPCTLKIWNYFRENKMMLVKSEYNIYSDDIVKKDAKTGKTYGIASSIDILFIDTNTWELGIAEIKNDNSDETYGARDDDPYFEFPFNDLKNCPQNRHQLQLMYQYYILKRDHGIEATKSCVLRVSKYLDKPIAYPLIGWAKKKKNENAYIKHLKDFINKKKDS